MKTRTSEHSGQNQASTKMGRLRGTPNGNFAESLWPTVSAAAHQVCCAFSSHHRPHNPDTDVVRLAESHVAFVQQCEQRVIRWLMSERWRPETTNVSTCSPTVQRARRASNVRTTVRAVFRFPSFNHNLHHCVFPPRTFDTFLW